jgi:hypothetical protein
MGKNKKRKTPSSLGNVPPCRGKERGKDDGPNANNDDKDTVNCKNNPLYREQLSFLSSITPHERDFYFSSLSSHAITPERRAELWMEQAEIGEGLVNRYAWATPTNECLQIFREFSPIVEIGSGSNAYWTKYMKQTVGIDVVAYDMNVQEGGKILSKATTVGAKEKKKRKMEKKSSDETIINGARDDVDGSLSFVVQKGGPEALKLPELRNHTLFLCYPDEEDAPIPDDDEQDSSQPLSFGWQCLTEYKGTHVIHVGELAVLGDATLNMEQSPWGRSSSSEFQQRLASEFHCIAKIQLPNWLHVRDSISVWKRSEICQMVFVADDDEEDDEDEIIEYRHIPPQEMLPRRVIAPCMEHVFAPSLLTKKETPTTKSRSGIKANEKKTTQNLHSTGEETSTSSTKSTTEVGAKSDLDNEIDDENEIEIETETEMQRKKTKRGTRRERQKQKKMLSMQRSSSQNGEDENKSEGRKEEKQMRSEYFRLHGKPPPQL